VGMSAIPFGSYLGRDDGVHAGVSSWTRVSDNVIPARGKLAGSYVNSALAKLSSGSKKFSIQLDFTQKLSDTLTSGIGHMVDADMAKESALLTSLQTKQQLGVQALSIANQAPQTVLSLFR